CAFNSNISNLNVNLQSITGEAPPQFNALVSIGASLAGFFALFTGSGAATAILEERRNGTLQRMFASPTQRITILLGLLIGTFVLVLLQLVFLF
ncbi:MAG TPA: ABC transporter permease, partial [Aggregatilineales bacterium]|nr:ABC transporter permease [Aggregatilineales bacterium]